jgi:hypothetical protein
MSLKEKKKAHGLFGLAATGELLFGLMAQMQLM